MLHFNTGFSVFDVLFGWIIYNQIRFELPLIDVMWSILPYSPPWHVGKSHANKEIEEHVQKYIDFQNKRFMLHFNKS